MTTVSDDFNRANEALDAGPWTLVNWSGTSAGFNIVSNQLVMQSTNRSGAIHDTPLTTDDHYVEATLVDFDGGVGARFDDLGTTGYFVNVYSADAELWKVVAGTVTLLDFNLGAAIAAGDKIFIQVVGDRITYGKVGGAARSFTDASITTGKRVGVAASGVDGILDNWFATDAPSLTTVQTKTYQSSAQALTHQIVLDSAPTEGNLIALVIATDAVISDVNSGDYDPATAYAGGNSDGRIYYRVAGAGESATITVTLPSSRHCAIWAREFSGNVPDQAQVLDRSASNVAAGSHTTQPSGTTAATQQVGTHAIAGFSQSGLLRNHSSYSRGFVEQTELSTSGAGTNIRISVASRAFIPMEAVDTTLTFDGNVSDSSSTGTVAVFRVAEALITADVTHGIILGHEVVGTVEEAIVAADVTHGIVLGHQVEASARVAADPTHGIVLGHAVEGSLGSTGDVTHGIVLGHSVEGTVEVPVDAQVTHGIVLGHQVEFTVEITITTRPIQPMADLRPIQPSFTAG